MSSKVTSIQGGKSSQPFYMFEVGMLVPDRTSNCGAMKETQLEIWATAIEALSEDEPFQQFRLLGKDNEVVFTCHAATFIYCRKHHENSPMFQGTR